MIKMFLQPVQRLGLIQNLVQLEREAADNDVAMALAAECRLMFYMRDVSLSHDTALVWGYVAHMVGLCKESLR